MALKDTLERLRQQEHEAAKWEQDKPQLIAEWQQAIVKLFEEIRGYLSEYQADGSMSFSEGEVGLSEESLGAYNARQMHISAPSAIIVLAPVGRIIVGATGRVDMYRQGRVGEFERVRLLRVQTSPSDQTPRWVIIPPPEAGMLKTTGAQTPSWLGGDPRFIPLTKQALEQAIEFLLSKQ